MTNLGQRVLLRMLLNRLHAEWRALGVQFKDLTPLRWPAELIRAHMLKRTPIGTMMEDVIKVIESNKKWESIISISNIYMMLLAGVYKVVEERLRKLYELLEMLE